MQINKRGVTQLLMLFELVIAVIVIIAMVGVAKNTVSGAKVSEKFIAKDAALMVDALHALPGDAVVNYVAVNIPEQKTILVLGGFLKLISDDETAILGAISTPYRESTSISIAENRVSLIPKQTNTIIFDKEGSTISLRHGE
ncbi:hypothetical protein JXB27_00870 [Candidatus Woesearchaeota archaeon]|nr:hypothetical protein [Candidatus Woesearchaeota archaeon]